MMAAGIQRHFKEHGQPSLSILAGKDARFAQARCALDARMKELKKQRVGVTPRIAEPLTPVQENKLWEKGIFSHDTGWGLLYAVFWYNCKLFGM